MIRLPFTLSTYIGKRFLTAILTTIGVMLMITGLIELLELLRRAGEVPRGVPFIVLLQMAFLKLPTTAEKIYPFAVMIGGMVTLARLTRTSELAVTRAAGVSVWQFLMPGVIVASVLGVIFVSAVNPIAAMTISQFDKLEGKYISNKPSQLSILPSGLWLRQSNEAGINFRKTPAQEYIMHAVRMNQSTYALENVMVLLFDTSEHFVGRMDAASASLKPGQWALADVTLSAPDSQPTHEAEYAMPTALTMSQIQDSFSAPETFSFWQLPGFIAVLEAAGFSALPHKLHFHSLMALPMLLAGMVLLSAVFSLRSSRRGRTGVLIATGLVIGFLVYFMTNIIYTLGSTGKLPIALAAWAPSLIVVMVAGATLLHLEDG